MQCSFYRSARLCRSSGTAILNGLASSRCTDAGVLAASKGAVVSVAASQFTENYAASFGGAISLDSASLAVKGSDFLNNTAGLYGGAVSQTGSGTDAVAIAGSTFSGNAAGCQGGSLFFYGLDSLAVTGSAFDGSFTALDPTTTTGGL